MIGIELECRLIVLHGLIEGPDLSIGKPKHTLRIWILRVFLNCLAQMADRSLEVLCLNRLAARSDVRTFIFFRLRQIGKCVLRGDGKSEKEHDCSSECFHIISSTKLPDSTRRPVRSASAAGWH